MRKLILLIAIIRFSVPAHALGVWTQKANYGGGTITEAAAFSIGSKGYIGAANTAL